jgi:hypothetical protein
MPSRRSRAGFSVQQEIMLLALLVAVAVALGLGYTFWLGRHRLDVAQTQLRQIVGNVRSLYGEQGQFPQKPHERATLAMVTAGVYPPEMFDGQNSASPQTPWHAPMEFYVADSGSFWLVVPDGVTPDICADMLARNVGLNADSGLVKVWRSDNTQGDPGGDAVGLLRVSNLQEAIRFCRDGASTGFGFLFRLK